MLEKNYHLKNYYISKSGSRKEKTYRIKSIIADCAVEIEKIKVQILI